MTKSATIDDRDLMGVPHLFINFTIKRKIGWEEYEINSHYEFIFDNFSGTFSVLPFFINAFNCQI